MTLKKSSLLSVLCLIALMLRLSVMFSDFSFDVLNHISWSKDIVNHGFDMIYETRSTESYGAEYPNYPPVALYLFAPLYFIFKPALQIILQLNTQYSFFPSFVIPFVENLHFVAALMKIPSIIADLGLAWVVGLMAQRLIPNRKDIRVIASSMILFHLTIFYNTALFGQIDTIPILFAALGLYFIQFVRRPVLAGILLTIGMLVKPTILVFFPVLWALMLYREGLKTTLAVIGMSIGLFWFFYLPITIHQPNILYPFSSYKTHVLDAQSVHAVTNAAYNMWALNPDLFFVDAKNPIFGMVSYELMGSVIAISFIGIILYKLWKNSFEIQSIFIGLGLSAYTAYLFLTKINERYLILVIPFLIIPALKFVGIRRAWIIVSIVSFLNLYKSWHVPRIEFAVYLLSTDWLVIILSAINITVFAYVFIQFWKFQPKSS